MATGTLGTSARDYHTRQTLYVGGQTLSPVTAGNFAPAINFKLGTVPAGASLVRILTVTSVVDNAAAPLITLGNSAGAAGIFASAAGGIATLGPTASTVIAAAANVIVASDTDVWVKNNSSAAFATSGTYQIFVEYVIP